MLLIDYASGLDGAVVVAVIAACVMEMSIYDVVDMVSVRNRFVTAGSAMFVTCVVFAAIMRTARNLARVREHMLIYVVAVHMMEMSIMKVVYVVVMFYCCVPAICSMGVSVIVVNFTSHLFSPEWK